MIQVVNIVSGKYTSNPTEDFNLSNVRTLEIIDTKCNSPIRIIIYVNISLVI